MAEQVAEDLLPVSAEQSADMEEVTVGETYPCRGPDGIYYDAEVIESRMNKRAGKEEFLVRYTDLANQKNEWVDKSRLVLSTPVMEEDTEDQDMPENGTTDQTPEDEGGEPEMKRAKVEAAEDLEDSLDSEPEDLAKELTCPLCKSHYKDPVIISCSHNFCRSCIEEAWSGQESFVCPDCETVMTEKMYIANRALDNLVKKSISTATVKTSVTPKSIETTMIPANCAEHDERLKLFCKEDGALTCLICRDSLKHSGHNFLPIMDAVEMYRTQLSAVTAPLQEALKATRQLTSKQREKIQQAKTNMEECEQHVGTEFKKLKDFIHQQKETLLKKLQEQGKDVVTQMENNLTKVQENEKNLEQAISLADEKMSETEATSFLTDTKSIIDKCQDQQAQSSSTILVDKQLNENTYKGPIMYSVWKEMRSLVSKDGDVSEAEPGGSLRGLFSTIGVPHESPSSTAARTRGGFLIPRKPVPDGDTESGDQDNLAAQAPEKPETGAQANQQTKPVTPGTAPKTVAGALGRPANSTPSTSYQLSQKAIQKTGQNSQGFSATTVSKPGVQKSGQAFQGLPAAVPSSEAKHVWFFGNGVIEQAKERACRTRYGLHLGLRHKNVTVHWVCSENMKWQHLLPELKKMELHMKRPDAIIIHLGENELQWGIHQALQKEIINILREVGCQYRGTVLMWSRILSRWEWGKKLHVFKIKKFNRAIAEQATRGHLYVIPHDSVEERIEQRWETLEQQGLVPQTTRPVDAELDMLNFDFQAAIMRVLKKT
ncbi:nuclear factor 7, brain-like isoform X2 [Hyperolius riggenbachi]|uniref:nuclear factor 7, brain-like isoform X2 n=1 Tax=Hyperolius riggenbachi TaxID=752182 RepID=UPI0035A285F4